ncbi:hypothetical protein PMAYCL1PPCAC_22160, partial [Pristionchus mayeri]
MIMSDINIHPLHSGSDECLSGVPLLRWFCAVSESCCAHLLTVEAPPGNTIGTVSQRPSCCVPNFVV